jgi:tripartite-type tricarboxylate transporter receptor subunit TctC
MQAWQRALAVAVLVSAVVAASAARAQAAAVAPIRLVVAGAPGSPPDSLARVVGEPFAADGQPVLVEDRPGAGGALAFGAVARSAPDGHTLGIGGLAQALAPALLSTQARDHAASLLPVTQLAWTANVLVVRATSPLRSVADLLVQARSSPGALSYASAGVGTASHLAAELFRHGAGLDVRHVPFKGIPSGLTALIGEQVDFAFAGVAAALPLLRSGKLRALATAGSARLPAVPDVPTLVESGLAEARLNEWYGVFAPPATPPRVIAERAREFARVMAIPQTRASLERIGMYPVDASGPEALAAVLRSDTQRWLRLVRELNIRIE